MIVRFPEQSEQISLCLRQLFQVFSNLINLVRSLDFSLVSTACS